MSLSMMFESVGLFYGLMLPVIILAIFAFLTLPMVFRPSIRAEAICRAVYCYLAQMLGILLMTAGGLPALYAVFTSQPVTELTYVGFLIVFGTGGILFLWHDAQLRYLDPASKAIPEALFFVTWKFAGLLITVMTGLSFALRLMLVENRTDNWWVVHMIMLLYGILLSWFTLNRPATNSITPIKPKTAPAPALIIRKPVPSPAATVKPAPAKPVPLAKKPLPQKKTQK